jgi:hypothetical protein
MVSINQTNNPNSKTEPRTVADVVCPFCFKPLPFPAVYSETSGPYGIRRGYQGWCPCCDRGAVVIQYSDAGRWKIEKIKEIKFIPTPAKDWTIIAAPEAAATIAPVPTEWGSDPILITGPGGDFTNQTTDAQIAQAIETYNYIKSQLASAGQSLLNIMLMKNKSV